MQTKQSQGAAGSGRGEPMTGRSRLRWAGLIIGLLAIQAVGFAWIITHQATPAAPAQTADVASPDADHGAVEGAERL